MTCTGNEPKIADCNLTTNLSDCDDVAVICEGILALTSLYLLIMITCADNLCDDEPVRLITNSTANEGVIEVCFLQFRAGICYEDIDTHTATLLCRQLGYDTNSPGNDTKL